MRLLFIVCEASVEERVEQILGQCDVCGYTRFTGATGHGKRGPREGTPVWPGLNSLILSCMPDETVPSIVAALDHLEADRGGRLALKVFSVPVDEYC